MNLCLFMMIKMSKRLTKRKLRAVLTYMDLDGRQRRVHIGLGETYRRLRKIVVFQGFYCVGLFVRGEERGDGEHNEEKREGRVVFESAKVPKKSVRSGRVFGGV